MFYALSTSTPRFLSALSVQSVNRHSRRGASLVEYVLLISLMALACFVATKYLGTNTTKPYSGAASGLDS